MLRRSPWYLYVKPFYESLLNIVEGVSWPIMSTTIGNEIVRLGTKEGQYVLTR